MVAIERSRVQFGKLTFHYFSHVLNLAAHGLETAKVEKDFSDYAIESDDFLRHNVYSAYGQFEMDDKSSLSLIAKLRIICKKLNKSKQLTLKFHQLSDWYSTHNVITTG